MTSHNRAKDWIAALSGIFVLLLLPYHAAGQMTAAASLSSRSDTRFTSKRVPSVWLPRVEWRISPTSVRADSASSHVGELLVNGQVILRLRTSQGRMSPEQRAQVAAERLQSLVSSGLQAGEIISDITTDKMNPRLKARGQVIATAGIEEAHEGNTSPAELVQHWNQALRRALVLPGLTVSVAANPLIVPVGETRAFTIGGVARGTIVAQTSTGDNRFVNISGDAANGQLIVTGIAKGRDTLILTREGATVTLPVAVQPYAGRFETPRLVTVTGSTTAPEIVARYAAAAAFAAVNANPGATVQIATDALNVAPLTEGQGQEVDVPMQISGTEMIPVTRTVHISVVNKRLSAVRTGTLFYSNNPERIKGYSTLFVARMPQVLETTRVLYHHQSAMSSTNLFTVELINDRDAAATVQVIGGEAGPVRDTVWAGYRAGSSFLRDSLADSGAILDIPPHSRVGLTATRMAPGMTISGLVQLRTLSGPPVLVRVAADIPGGEQSLPAILTAYPTNWSEKSAGINYTLSEHVYTEPTKKVEVSYRAGERWQFIPLGRAPLKSDNHAKTLEGNYGVFYDITLHLENPTEETAPVKVAFEPSAGLAGCVFLIDNKSVEIPQTNLPTESTLATYSLAPHEKKTVQIKTLPLSGSNYPATIIVRP